MHRFTSNRMAFLGIQLYLLICRQGSVNPQSVSALRAPGLALQVIPCETTVPSPFWPFLGDAERHRLLCEVRDPGASCSRSGAAHRGLSAVRCLSALAHSARAIVCAVEVHFHQSALRPASGHGAGLQTSESALVALAPVRLCQDVHSWLLWQSQASDKSEPLPSLRATPHVRPSRSRPRSCRLPRSLTAPGPTRDLPTKMPSPEAKGGDAKAAISEEQGLQASGREASGSSGSAFG